MPAQDSNTVSATWLVELLEAALTGADTESPDNCLIVNNHEISITIREAKELVRQLSEQPPVELVITGNGLTTTTAAQLLNVSGQYLVRLCEAGVLSYRMESTQRRLALTDVLEYRERRDKERRKRFSEHVRAAAEAGEYDNLEEWLLP